MKVSIIIPCYNVQRFIEKCLLAVFAQSHKDLEIICVDDGSSDETVAIIRQVMASSLGNIKLFTQENQGAPAARNKGLSEASGAFFQFLDADDILHPSKIASQLSLAEKDSSDIIVGSYTRKKESGEKMFSRIYGDSRMTESILILLMKTDLGITSSNLFRRRLFDEGIRWDTTLKSSQEYDLMFRLIKGGAKVDFDDKDYTSIIDRDAGSISKSNKAANWNRYTDLRVRIFNYITQNGSQKELQDAKQVLFDAIRILYTYDKERALKLFKEHLSTNFKPVVSPSTGKLYVTLYRFFGFAKTEKIRATIS